MPSISIELTPQAQAVIEQASQMAGVSVANFIGENAYQQALQLTHNKVPNAQTIQAINELAEGKGVKFNSVDELIADLNA